MLHTKAIDADRKRHHSSDTDSSDITNSAQPDETTGTTTPIDMSPSHGRVVPSSERAVSKQTKAALVKKLRDSTKQHHMEQVKNPEVASPGAGKPKVAKQDHLVSPVIARGHHKTHISQTRSSLLEDVLNEKKLALLQSPDVRAFLERAQRSVAEEKCHSHRPSEGSTRPGNLEECVMKSADDKPHHHDNYLSSSEARDAWCNARTTNVAGADIWSKEASAFTSVVRPTQQ